MSKQEIVNQYAKSAKSLEVLKQIQQDKNHFQITNLVGSSLSFVISETFKKVNKSKKRTSVKKNSSPNKPSINLNDSYNG